MESKRLYRSQTDRKFAGVAGGLAEYFVMDPLLIRLVFVVLALAGGGGFILFSQLAWFLAGKGSGLALTCEVIAFAFAGLGTSFMAPIFTTVANRRSPLKASEVVSQLNLANTVMIFGAKLIISWIAQATSITIALLVPGLALMSVAKFAYLGNPNRVGQK